MSLRSTQSTPPLFFYITDVDLSSDDGPGVNEWGFVSSLSTLYPDRFICFAPRPARPEGRSCPEIQYVAGHRGLSPIFYIIFQLDLLRKVAIAARQCRPDGIIYRPSIFPLVPLLLVTWLDVPLFIKMTGMGAFTVLSEKYFPLGKYVLQPVTSWMYKRLFRRVQLVEAVSKTMAAWVMRMFELSPHRVVVVPNGVDRDLFHPRPSKRARAEVGFASESPIVGFVGNLNSWYTGIDLLIDAAPHIVQERPNVRFVIVGDGRERQKLESLAQERNLNQYFLFQGHVAYEELPKYISAFDVAVVLWPTERMESLGSSAIKLGEYLACGRPVVASCGDGHEFLEENRIGWLVIPEEPEQVAVTICRALDIPEAERESMSERASVFVDDYLSTASLAHRRYELWTRYIGTSGSYQR